MEAPQEEDKLNELINQIESCEKTEEVIGWMQSISDTSLGLIDLLIQVFNENINDIKICNKILKVLRKLNEYVPENVLKQMRANAELPVAISKYITQTKVKEMVGDGFVLLVDIFQSNSFKSVINQKFIKALIDDLEYISDEVTFNSIIFILISLSFDCPNLGENDVIKLLQNHPNQRFFQESLVQLINKSDNIIMHKCLKFVQDVFSLQIQFFYSYDLKILIDILIRETSNLSDEEMRIEVVRTLLYIVKSNDYLKLKYRTADIISLCEENQQLPNIGQISKNLGDEITKYIHE